MKPRKSILDPSFRYVPAVATSVAKTWRRFGWKPSNGRTHERRASDANTSIVPDWKLGHAAKMRA